MSSPSGKNVDNALIILGLTLLEELLPLSRYPKETREGMQARIRFIIEDMSTPKDVYGNPY